ncbi:MAG: WD40 repeat domain-containing serine/threonine protein kinase, partial [Planctomycetota bacterium]
NPSIARVYGAGTNTDVVPARPYFVTEYVEGLTLSAWLRAKPRTPKDVVQVVRGIVDALGYAHARGIVHRDVKPGNVLIDAAGRPRVLDFGVAAIERPEASEDPLGHLTRTLELAPTRSLVGATREGSVLGTVPYMSPEQLVGTAAVDARSDLYSVGVVLFESLVGRLPFPVERMTLPEAAATIRDEEPSTIGRFDRALRGDLEAIVARLLEKEPGRRYQTAQELVDDLDRYLADQPTRTRPATALERARRFTRRYRSLIASVAVAFTVLVGFLGYAVSLWQVAEDRGDALAATLEESRRTEYRRAVHYSEAVLRAGMVRDARQALAATDPARRGWEWRYLMARAGGESRVVEFPGVLVSIASRDGTTAIADVRGDLFFVDEAAGSARLVSRRQRTVSGVAVRPGGREVATVEVSEPTIVIQDARTGTPTRILDTGLGTAHSIAWSDDGALIAVAGLDGSLAVIDEASGRVLCVHPISASERRSRQVEGLVAFLPGTRTVIAAGRSEGRARILPSPEAQPIEIVELKDVVIESVGGCRGANGPLALVGSFDGRLHVIEPADGQVLRIVKAHEGTLRAIAAGPGEGRCATGGTDGRIHLWNVDDGVSVGDAVGSELHVRGLAVDTRSGDILAVGDDRCLRRWSTARQVLEPVLRGHRAWVYALAFLPDGTLLSGAGEAPQVDGRVIAWDLAARRPRWQQKLAGLDDPNIVWRIVPDPLGTAIAASARGVHFVSADGVVERRLARSTYDLAAIDGGRLVAVLEWESPDLAIYDRDGRLHGSFPRGSAAMGALCADRDGRTLALVQGARLRRFSVSEGRLAELPEVALRGNGRSVAIAADAPVIAVGFEGGAVQVFDASDARGALELWHAAANPGEIARVALSPDGTRLATGGTGPSIRLWDARSGDMLLALDGHGDTVIDLRFSPDGAMLASSSIDGTVRLWMAQSGAEVKR